MGIAVRDVSKQVSSNINVTPMVDVMLVLLIIFMVITPMLQNKVAVDMAIRARRSTFAPMRGRSSGRWKTQSTRCARRAWKTWVFSPRSANPARRRAANKHAPDLGAVERFRRNLRSSKPWQCQWEAGVVTRPRLT